jgi:hypothetical protein
VDEPTDAVRAAIDAYRARGYSIALVSHAEEWKDNHWLLSLQPDVVRLDSALLKKPEQLNLLALRLADYGVRSLIGTDTDAQAKRAAAAGVELVQHAARKTDRSGVPGSIRRSELATAHAVS